MDIAATRQLDQEGFFTSLRVTRKSPVGETAAVGFILGVNHPAWDREPQWSEAWPKNHDGARSGRLDSAHGRQAGLAVHLPTEQSLGGALEGVSTLSDHDVTKHMVISRRQYDIACRADLQVRQVGGGQLGEDPGRCVSH